VLANDALLQPPFPAEVLGVDIAGYWEGRQLLIETRPTAPEEPQRRHLVTLDAPAEAIDDPLTGAAGLVRLHWRAEDALPFELDQTTARVCANLVPVRAGLTLRAEFATGPGGSAGLPRSVERAGPWQETVAACDICGTEAAGARPVIHRFTLPATVAAGLGWEAGTDAAGAPDPRPDVALHEADGAEWQIAPEALGLGPTSRAVVLEAGHYAPIARFERRGEVYQHLDYAGDAGQTLRFGDGRFGRLPGRGTAFAVHYRTGPGRQGNVPADTIRRLDPPEGTPPALVEAPPGLAAWELRNPFAVTDGRDPQPLEHARRTAAAAARALTYRAVRNADYREQAERLDWVEQAGAVTRWTGAWATTFVTADPRGQFEMSAGQTAELAGRMGAVRQVGRPVILRQPVFVALDLQIAICTARGHAFGAVAARVLRALGTGPGGFFHPDRFSFADPLRRPELEAAIAAVEGVAAVLAIRLRPRGQRDYLLFDFPALEVAANRILRVENDPDRPGSGSIRIYAEALPEPEAAT
jgi:hypothetical protein